VWEGQTGLSGIAGSRRLYRLPDARLNPPPPARVVSFSRARSSLLGARPCVHKNLSIAYLYQGRHSPLSPLATFERP
jgi:hypothetical protein